MKLEFESQNITDYLGEIPPVIKFDTPLVMEKVTWIRSQAKSKRDQARLAFEIARDEIHHSFDTGFEKVTITGEDVLKNHEGICFAKAHLLATLTRALEIPTGFCYQRVLRKKTVESGYALHGLNAIYLNDFGWFRVDPRGNKPGIDSEFTIEEERLAYVIHPDLGEIDYPYVYTHPLRSVITSMEDSKNTQELFFKRPESAKGFGEMKI